MRVLPSPGQLLNDGVCDAIVAAGWSYFVGSYGAKDLVHFMGSMIGPACMQPILATALDDVFKKRVKYLSPIASTLFCYGVPAYVALGTGRLTLSGDARFYATASVAYLAFIKGSFRMVFNSGCYPSLAGCVTVPAGGIKSLYNGISSLVSGAITSQFVRSKVDSIYWAFSRYRENPCNNPELEPKEV